MRVRAHTCVEESRLCVTRKLKSFPCGIEKLLHVHLHLHLHSYSYSYLHLYSYLHSHLRLRLHLRISNLYKSSHNLVKSFEQQVGLVGLWA